MPDIPDPDEPVAAGRRRCVFIRSPLPLGKAGDRGGISLLRREPCSGRLRGEQCVRYGSGSPAVASRLRHPPTGARFTWAGAQQIYSGPTMLPFQHVFPAIGRRAGRILSSNEGPGTRRQRRHTTTQRRVIGFARHGQARARWGTGAIIGAQAVVTSTCPAYQIVVGTGSSHPYAVSTGRDTCS